MEKATEFLKTNFSSKFDQELCNYYCLSTKVLKQHLESVIPVPDKNTE